jgi:hypothetical protein
MRTTGCLCALLGALLALPAAIAQARITPLPKPAGIAAKPATSTGGSLITPVPRPATRTTVRPAATPPPRPHIASTPTTATSPTSAPRRRRLVAAAIHGGRERDWVAPSGGGRDASALAATTAILPTPLDLVGAGESLPAHDNALPSWKIVLLNLLACAEAFVLVRLVRGSRLAPAGDL